MKNIGTTKLRSPSAWYELFIPKDHIPVQQVPMVTKGRTFAFQDSYQLQQILTFRRVERTGILTFS